jgi:predicted  nucleic acid-binding Zn-ribbon protein
MSVAVKMFAESLRNNPELPVTPCNGRDVCPLIFSEAHRNLCVSVCSVLLLAAYSTFSSDQPRIEQETIFLLLQNQQRLTSCPVVCHKEYPGQGRPLYIETVSILEQKSTPEHPRISHNWRERLALDLSRDSGHMHDLIIKKFGAVCRDLEERCDVAEAPLREEQSRTAALTVECQAAQNRILQLESELRDFKASLESSNAEGARLKAEVNTLHADIEAAENEVQGLELRLQEICRDRVTRLAVATERAKLQDMEHLAALALKDESIEELYDATKGLEKTVEDQKSAAALAEQKLEQAQNTIGALQATSSEYEQEIAQQRTLAAANQQIIAGLEESRQTLRENIDDLTENVRSGRLLRADYPRADSIDCSCRLQNPTVRRCVPSLRRRKRA